MLCTSNTRRIAFAAVAMAVLLLSGCANQEITMSMENRAKLTQTSVLVETTQEEIYADINRSQVSAVTGGGLIGALIDAAVDNSRAKDAEAGVVPYRNALLGYDVTGTLKDNLTASLGRVDWLKTNTFEVMRVEHQSGNAEPAIPARAPANSALEVRLSYYLAPDFKSLKIHADVRLALADKKESVFRHHYDMSSPMPPGGSAVDSWTQDHGAPLRSALDSQLKLLADKISEDLNNPTLKAGS